MLKKDYLARVHCQRKDPWQCTVCRHNPLADCTLCLQKDRKGLHCQLCQVDRGRLSSLCDHGTGKSKHSQFAPPEDFLFRCSPVDRYNSIEFACVRKLVTGLLRGEIDTAGVSDMAHSLITCDPAVMLGKPVVAGTRITVELILEKLGAGESMEDLLLDYPQLSREAVQAALRFAHLVMRNDVVYPAREQVA
jgi:uncharacterized protein (DUF433 family)